MPPFPSKHGHKMATVFDIYIGCLWGQLSAVQRFGAPGFAIMRCNVSAILLGN